MLLRETVPWFGQRRDGSHTTVEEILIDFYLRDGDLGHAASSMNWIRDGVDLHEPELMGSLQQIVDAHFEVGKQLLRQPWMADEQAEFERHLISRLADIARKNPELAGQVGTYSLSTESRERDLNAYVLDSLSRLAEAESEVFPLVIGQSWFTDGLSDEEAALVASLGSIVLKPAPTISDLSVSDFLETRYTQSGSVSLPLAGEVKIWIIQNTAFAADDDVLGIVQDAALALESFLGMPFPTTDIVLLSEDLRTASGNTVNIGGFNALNHGTHITATRVDQQTDEEFRWFINHEMTHYYSFQLQWFNEGVAGFMEGYIDDRNGLKPLPERSRALYEDVQSSCFIDEEIENLRHSVFQDQHFFYYGISPCTYQIGEHFVHRIFETIGETALSAALRELRIYPGGTVWGQAGEELVYNTLLKHTSSDRRTEFRELYNQLYGGVPASFESAPSDDHSDEISDATVLVIGHAVRGRLDYKFDADFFRFEAKLGQQYQMDVQHDDLRASSVMLYSSEGKRTTWKSRARISSGPRIQWIAPSAGSYYFAVHNFGGNTGEYSLKITSVDKFADDHGDSAAEATEVTLGDVVSGEIDVASDLDFFRFDGVEGQGYGMEIIGGTIQDMCCVDVYSPEYGHIGEGGKGTLFWASRSGPQYAVVHGGGGNAGTYQLRITKLE